MKEKHTFEKMKGIIMKGKSRNQGHTGNKTQNKNKQTAKNKNIYNKSKKISITDPQKNTGVYPGAREM